MGFNSAIKGLISVNVLVLMGVKEKSDIIDSIQRKRLQWYVLPAFQVQVLI
jgi:hypothetical protein